MVCRRRTERRRRSTAVRETKRETRGEHEREWVRNTHLQRWVRLERAVHHVVRLRGRNTRSISQRRLRPGSSHCACADRPRTPQNPAGVLGGRVGGGWGAQIPSRMQSLRLPPHRGSRGLRGCAGWGVGAEGPVWRTSSGVMIARVEMWWTWNMIAKQPISPSTAQPRNDLISRARACLSKPRALRAQLGSAGTAWLAATAVA